MPQNTFDATVAATYDSDSANMFEQALLGRTVEFLAGFAGDGGALEFGIGTGRVALPLSQRGVRVSGLDISEAMVARLREKPGANAIPVTIGDIASTRVPGEFALVYLPFNIIANLLTQAEQVACFQSAAAHLRPGGYVVAETFVPALRRLQPGETFVPFSVTRSHLGFDAYDVVAQACTSHHYFFRGKKTQFFESRHRYVWPAEMDLMARIAGLELVERWADWARAPFTGESTDHISVWGKPA